MLKNDWIKIRISKEEKTEWKQWAQKKHMNLSQFIFYKIYSAHYEGTKGTQFQVNNRFDLNRPWEFDHRIVKSKTGRKLPIIPGTPQWKAQQFHTNKLEMISELKEKLLQRRILLEPVEICS
jgi:hypothetical protein